MILRLATVCGASPRMRFDLMVNTITARASAEGRVRIVGASQWRAHIHVQDVAEVFVRAVEAPTCVASGGVFNVGADHLNFIPDGEIADKVVHRAWRRPATTAAGCRRRLWTRRRASASLGRP